MRFRIPYSSLWFFIVTTKIIRGHSSTSTCVNAVLCHRHRSVGSMTNVKNYAKVSKQIWRMPQPKLGWTQDVDVTILNRNANLRLQKIEKEAECNGYSNFIHDLEIVSLQLTVVAFLKASVAWCLHLLNQAYGFISVYVIGMKERLTFLINLFRPDTIPEDIERIFDILGSLDYLVIRYISYPVGNLILVIDTLGQIFGFVSLVLDSISTFSDLFEESVLHIFGIDLKRELRGYACNNPFQQKTENVFQHILL